MADLSSIQIPGGSVFNIKDAEARAGYAIATPALASGTYSLANRTVNKLALTSGSSITVSPPEGVSGHVPDCLLDIDNSDNSSAVQVTCSGAVLAVPGGIDIDRMMAVPAQSRARFAFTGLGLTVPQSSGSSTQVPLMSVRRVLYSVDASWVTHPDAPEGDGMVDESLSSTSENPVQNKTVTAALDGKTDLSVIAPEFDSTESYAANQDFVIHEGVLYQCTTAHQGTWDATHFTATDVNTALQAAASSGSSGTPSDTSPLMDGMADVGTENAYARGDHRHPTDTSLMPKMATGTANYFTVSKTDGTIQRSYYTSSSFAAASHTHAASSVYTSYRSGDVESVLSEIDSRLSTVESECCGGGGGEDSFVTLGTLYNNSMNITAYPNYLPIDTQGSMLSPDSSSVAPCLMVRASEVMDPSMGLPDFSSGGSIKSEYMGAYVGVSYTSDVMCTTGEFVVSLYDNTCYGNADVLDSMNWDVFQYAMAPIGYLAQDSYGDWWLCFAPRLDLYGVSPTQSYSPDMPGDLAYMLAMDLDLCDGSAVVTANWGSWDPCMQYWDDSGCFGAHSAQVEIETSSTFSPSGGCL